MLFGVIYCQLVDTESENSLVRPCWYIKHLYN